MARKWLRFKNILNSSFKNILLGTHTTLLRLHTRWLCLTVALSGLKTQKYQKWQKAMDTVIEINTHFLNYIQINSNQRKSITRAHTYPIVKRILHVVRVLQCPFSRCLIVLFPVGAVQLSNLRHEWIVRIRIR